MPRHFESKCVSMKYVLAVGSCSVVACHLIGLCHCFFLKMFHIDSFVFHYTCYTLPPYVTGRNTVLKDYSFVIHKTIFKHKNRILSSLVEIWRSKSLSDSQIKTGERLLSSANRVLSFSCSLPTQFTVHIRSGYYTFRVKGTFLRSSEPAKRAGTCSTAPWILTRVCSESDEEVSVLHKPELNASTI
jgi:hypothetical protein